MKFKVIKLFTLRVWDKQKSWNLANVGLKSKIPVSNFINKILKTRTRKKEKGNRDRKETRKEKQKGKEKVGEK